MSTKHDLIVAGHICLDIIPRFQYTAAKQITEIMLPGKLVNMKDVVVSTGGPVSNTGLNAKKLGMNVGFMGKVGADFFGRGLLAILEEKGAAQGMIVAQGEDTSYTVVLAPPGIDRIFLHCPGANDTYSSKDVDYRAAENTRVFHLGYPPLMHALYRDDGAELTRIFKNVKALGVTTSLDMSLPDPDSPAGKVDWETILKNTLPYVDIFLPSVEESAFMLDRALFDRVKKAAGTRDAIDFYTIDDVRKLAARFLEMGAKMAVLKSSHRGAYVRTAGAQALAAITAVAPEVLRRWNGVEIWGEAFVPPTFGSATGSGDSFIAGFLTAFLRGYEPEKTMRFANCVGCQNVTMLDAVSGIKTHDETLELMRTFQHRPADIASPAWAKTENGIWKPTA
jgi:sugar/nucleoside kinase (ribokinase family)